MSESAARLRFGARTFGAAAPSCGGGGGDSARGLSSYAVFGTSGAVQGGGGAPARGDLRTHAGRRDHLRAMCLAPARCARARFHANMAPAAGTNVRACCATALVSLASPGRAGPRAGQGRAGPGGPKSNLQ